MNKKFIRAKKSEAVDKLLFMCVTIKIIRRGGPLCPPD